MPKDFWAKNERLYQKFEDISPKYRELIDRHSQYVERYGFAYLNSKYCIDLWSDLSESMKVAIENIGEEELLRTYECWKDVIEHRDRTMMKNIQKYSEEHEFNTGIFLVGAAHRRAIMEKSENLTLRNSVTLDWNFEKYEGLI